MKRATPLLAIVLLPLALASCVSVKRAAPDVRTYVLEAPRPASAPVASTPQGNLIIGDVTISPTYAKSAFVLRVDEWEVREDFYNRWNVEPQAAFRHALAQWIDASAAYHDVQLGGRPRPGTHTLTAHIEQLQIDLRDKPAAVIEVTYRLAVTDAAGRETDVRQVRASAREPLASVTPANMAAAWNKAAAASFQTLEGELAKTP